MAVVNPEVIADEPFMLPLMIYQIVCILLHLLGTILQIGTMTCLKIKALVGHTIKTLSNEIIQKEIILILKKPN